MKLYSCLLITMFWIVSCRQPEEPPTFSSLIVRNAWKVGYSRDNSNIFTNLYSSWKISFNSDGTCVVNDGTNTLNGTWEENIPARTVKLFINSSSLQASFISREWDLVFMNPGRIKLADDRFSPTQEVYLDRL